MQIVVTVGTAEEFAAAYPRPDRKLNKLESDAYIGEILRAAAEEGRKSVDIQGIAEMEKVSDIAGAARLMEQPVIDFARENALPETVRFVCDSEKVATLYKVVYNMYYADSKETRLEDERWD